MYYKILNENLKHNNMQYHEGLNENCEKNLYDKNAGHGIFFTDEEHVFDFFNYGCKLAEVELPENEEMVDCGGKFKAHRVILKNIRNLWSLDNLKGMEERGINMHACHEWAFRWAAGEGKLEAVEYFVEHGIDIHIDGDAALQDAMKNGHFETAKYLLQNGADIHACNDLALRWAEPETCAKIKRYLFVQKLQSALTKYLPHTDRALTA